MSNTTFVIAAFTVTWAAILGYVIHLRRLTRRAAAAYAAASKAGAP
jgi:CcmD family protein